MPLLYGAGRPLRWSGIRDFLADDLGKELFMLFTINIIEQTIQKGIRPEEAFAGAHSLTMIQLDPHESIRCRVVRLHYWLGRHVSGNPLGIPDHCQQVACRQPLVGAISNAYLFRQQKRVGYCPSEFVSALCFGAPVNAAVTLH